jgi:FSR family fosmidomycin resistance protein-like MFS transporter
MVAAIFLSAVGLAPNFPTLAALVMVGGLGASAFHPQAAVIASSLSKRSSLSYSLFVTGGTIGFSLGPVFAVGVVGAFGLERSWVAAFPGLVMAALLIFWFSKVTPTTRSAQARPALAELRPVARTLGLLYSAVVLRSAVSFGFMIYLPIYLHQRGFSVRAGGGLLAAYLLSGGVGGFLGGWLSDRWGGRQVVLRSFIVATPLYFAFLLLPLGLGLACLILGSLALQASLPVNVVMGQQLSPRHSSTISSLLMGAAWGIGTLLVGPTGMLADARGLPMALACLTCLLPVGCVCGAALPDIRRPVPSVELLSPSAAIEQS